jgi:hypothetical protein
MHKFSIIFSSQVGALLGKGGRSQCLNANSLNVQSLGQLNRVTIESNVRLRERERERENEKEMPPLWKWKHGNSMQIKPAASFLSSRKDQAAFPAKCYLCSQFMYYFTEQVEYIQTYTNTYM